jgi:hypothetical protein
MHSDVPVRTIERDELRHKVDEKASRFKLVMTLGDWEFRTKHIPGSLHFKDVSEMLSGSMRMGSGSVGSRSITLSRVTCARLVKGVDESPVGRKLVTSAEKGHLKPFERAPQASISALTVGVPGGPVHPWCAPDRRSSRRVRHQACQLRVDPPTEDGSVFS